MRRTIVLIFIVALLLTGCSWMDGEYHSVTPHSAAGNQETQEPASVRGFVELREALFALVEDGRQKGTFFTTGMDEETIDRYMRTSIRDMFMNNAVGAYAVEDITYTSGAAGNNIAIVVDVKYIHPRNEILRIKRAEDMTAVENSVASSLKKCEASTVIRVKNYEEIDLVQFVENYVNENPDICMEMPQVSTAVYPEWGNDRVIEINFTYQTARDALRNMQDVVDPIFSSAQMYVQSSEEPLQKFEQLYSFLMERFDYKLETSINPAYSLLRYGVGDSRAFALVYATMCKNADLECQVIPGTRNGEPWNWNMILLDDTYYHVDLLTCAENGAFTLMTVDEMEDYVWDYVSYE